MIIRVICTPCNTRCALYFNLLENPPYLRFNQELVAKLLYYSPRIEYFAPNSLQASRMVSLF